ncbi:Imm51 family immunity protein [Terrimonas alba]|uniref:Imm51 family immunity protein n=1 Tax=Terrimonas alba TaxID=3349636 RepID=UPI0035F47275
MTSIKMNIVIATTLLIALSCGQLNSSTNESGQLVVKEEERKKESTNIPNTDTIKPLTKETPANKYFPFELLDIEGHFQIVAPIESKDLYPKYYDFFQKHGYEGNGYCWQGHITQILEQLDKSLLKHIDFDPEAGGFYATADTKENQLKFVELLSPIFSDLRKLEEWIKKADRSRIDD